MLARRYRWAPLGGKEGNFGLVNIGSDPALAFVERITNAIDAVLERYAEAATAELVRASETPREASAILVPIPDGRLRNLDAASALSPSLTPDLVSSTRDRLKCGATYRALLDAVRAAYSTMPNSPRSSRSAGALLESDVAADQQTPAASLRRTDGRISARSRARGPRRAKRTRDDGGRSPPQLRGPDRRRR